MADVTPDLREILAVLDEKGEAAAIGATWLGSGNRRPRSAPEAFDRLARNLRAHGWSGGGDPETLRSAYAAAIADDYLNGAIVDVAGWRLATSEAELGAIAYLAAES